MNFFKNKNKITHVILVTIILVISTVWLYNIKPDTKQTIAPKIQYRGLVDSVSMLEYILQEEITEQTSDKIDYTNYMNDLTTLGIILGTIVTLVGTVLSYRSKVSFDKIDLRLEKNDNDHANIVNASTSNYQSIVEEISKVKDLNLRKNIIVGFRDIINSYTRMTNDLILKPFIDAEGERLITFAEEVMNENFTEKVLEQAFIKIDYTLLEAKEEALKIFTHVEYELFCRLQERNVQFLKHSLQRIASDHLLNNKYERFKTVCESFLHDHLMDVIRIRLH